ncbi:hypothetical protein [Xanthomonas theicola]|nr:hypothetical protein [Xanthomonas theicola]QNH26569.1 transposase family protein [Xanthomonas theicola]
MPDDPGRQAFRNACPAAPVGAGVLFRSDRGSQHASGDVGKTLSAHGVVPGHAPPGQLLGARSPPSGHSAVAERFFASLKNQQATGVYGKGGGPCCHRQLHPRLLQLQHACTRHWVACRPTTLQADGSKPLDPVLLGVRS